MRESTMAFVCPSCGQGDLCPAGPCAGPAVGPECCDSSCAQSVSRHVLSLAEVQVLQCNCGLQIRRGENGGCHDNYFDDCLAQETRVFALPWRDVLGRDHSKVGPTGTSLLARTHWLLADHASHMLENAPAVFNVQGLSSLGANADHVRQALQELEVSVDTLACTLERLAGQTCVLVLPELFLYKALCTGVQEDFQACLDAHNNVLKDTKGSCGALAAAEQICTCRRRFIAMGLQLQPAAAERLWLQMQSGSSSDAGILQCSLQQERAIVEAWVGSSTIGKETSSSSGEEIWILRRMWLCPDFGWCRPTSDDEDERISKKPARRSPHLQKRPAGKKPAAAGAVVKSSSKKRGSPLKDGQINRQVRHKPASRAGHGR